MDTNLGSSGLLRYRSAPSSLFAGFDGEEENIFARFLSEVGDKEGGSAKNIDSRFGRGVHGGDGAEQMVYHGPPPRPPQLPPPPVVSTGSNLTRQSSSPAGFFGDLSGENGYVIRGVGNFRAGNSGHGDAMPPTSRLKHQLSFSSVTPSSSGLMSPISEIESESIETSNSDGESLGLNNVGSHYPPNFPGSTWDDSALGNFTSLKRFRDGNTKMNSGENQIQEVGNQTRNLTHHFSLPKTSAEMAAILQFQDSVPCKIRAKRGCATHPRSIAERVRRTRISERMKKLQELVPNMDKQTNTADMLDLAVDYIKELQNHVKKLNEDRASCTCSSNQKPH